jgi:hypothetical protein
METDAMKPMLRKTRALLLATLDDLARVPVTTGSNGNARTALRDSVAAALHLLCDGDDRGPAAGGCWVAL